MTPSDLTLTAMCALAAATVAVTVAYSKIAQPVRMVAARWEWTFTFVTCAWCLSAWLSAAVLALKGPNVGDTTDWPLLWLATWGLAGLVAAAVRVVALPPAQTIEEKDWATETNRASLAAGEELIRRSHEEDA